MSAPLLFATPPPPPEDRFSPVAAHITMPDPHILGSNYTQDIHTKSKSTAMSRCFPLFLGTSTKQRIKCLDQGNNTVLLVSLDLVALPFKV